MDYHRIYREFIKDRREKEPGLTGYTECHHILPRSLGGGDEPENLIRLTAEDHYFAHLLLAKMHGGRMWAAVYAMCYLANDATGRDRSKLSVRIEFGHVRRSLAEYYRSILSGPDGKIADKRVFVLHHQDGRVARGNRFELSDVTGVTRQQISALLRGAKKNAHGWYCKLHNPHGLTRGDLLSVALSDDTVHTLYHYDGRKWSGTLSEFKEMTGCRMTWQGSNHRSIKGWYRSRADASRHFDRISDKAKRTAACRGDISGAANPRHDATVYEFWNHLTGCRFSGTRFDLCQTAGIPYGEMSELMAERRQSVKGWTLWRRRNEKFRKPRAERSAISDGAKRTLEYQRESLSVSH